MRTPIFIVATLCAMISQAVMNLLMTSTPLAMSHNDFLFADTALVIQWHTFGMFAPGFFTGSLIKRFGVVQVIASGFALQLGAVTIALSGLGLGHFWFSMALLGVGWNFAFTGGSTLLTQVHTPSERAKTQGASNFIIFAVVAIGSLSSGALHHFFGWRWVNLGALPLIVMAALAVIWFALSQRPAAGQAPSG